MKALLFIVALAFSTLVFAKENRGGTHVNDTFKGSGSKYALWNDLEQPPSAVVAYLGIYNVGIYPLPMVIGSDFRTLLSDEWAIRGGFLYWTATGWLSGATATMFDISAGAGHVWTIKRVEIEGGGRLGYDIFRVSKEGLDWDVFGKSGNTFVIMPYASGAFKFTKEWSVGVELRLPFYLKSVGFTLNQPYILTQGSYHF